MMERLEKIVASEAMVVLEPAVAYTVSEIVVEDGRILTSDGEFIESPSIAKLFADCKMALFYAATVGEYLDNLIERLSFSGETVEAMLWDVVGSEGTEEIARFVSRVSHNRAHLAGMTSTARRSPGYGDFTLSNQPVVLKISGGDEIGIHLSEGNYLIPRKSTTGVLGWAKIARG